MNNIISTNNHKGDEMDLLSVVPVLGIGLMVGLHYLGKPKFEGVSRKIVRTENSQELRNSVINENIFWEATHI